MSKWIKCSEKMPPRDQEVLVVTPWKDVAVGFFRFSGQIEEGKGWVKKDMWTMDNRYFFGHDAESYEYNLDQIEYWQPLPPPPQE